MTAFTTVVEEWLCLNPKERKVRQSLQFHSPNQVYKYAEKPAVVEKLIGIILYIVSHKRKMYISGCFIMSTIRSVSYTHLDVYKRQI